MWTDNQADWPVGGLERGVLIYFPLQLEHAVDRLKLKR